MHAQSTERTLFNFLILGKSKFPPKKFLYHHPQIPVAPVASRAGEGVFIRDDGMEIPTAVRSETIDAIYKFAEATCPAAAGRDEDDDADEDGGNDDDVEEEKNDSGEDDEDDDNDKAEEDAPEASTDDGEDRVRPMSVAGAFDAAFQKWLKSEKVIFLM